MGDVFKKKRRAEMYNYSRPKIAYYENEAGATVSSPPNALMIEYKDGYPYGLKLGNGDYLQIPLDTESPWTSDTGTMILVMNAPSGVEFAKSGDLVVSGVGAMKTYIINVPVGVVLDNLIEVSFNRNILTEPENAHILMVKYYKETIDFSPYTEFEAMEELNLFTHGIWS
jgi:hypothetical protein